MKINDFINPEHEGFYYEPDTGRLFKIEEVPVCYLDEGDGKVRPYKRTLKGKFKPTTHLIYYIMTGEWPESGMVIDHKNGDGFDNSWANLRKATYAQNAHNRQPAPRWNDANLNLEKGVTRSTSAPNRFNVRFQKVHYGTFATVEEANAASRKIRRELYGEFDYGAQE